MCMCCRWSSAAQTKWLDCSTPRMCSKAACGPTIAKISRRAYGSRSEGAATRRNDALDDVAQHGRICRLGREVATVPMVCGKYSIDLAVLKGHEFIRAESARSEN